MNASVACYAHQLIIIGNKSGAPRASSFELSAHILIKAARLELSRKKKMSRGKRDVIEAICSRNSEPVKA
jgi:hypothetical protein